MKLEKKNVSVKGYGNKKHKFEIETMTVSGHTFITLKKNNRIIVRCDPREFVKLKLLFCD